MLSLSTSEQLLVKQAGRPLRNKLHSTHGEARVRLMAHTPIFFANHAATKILYCSAPVLLLKDLALLTSVCIISVDVFFLPCLSMADVTNQIWLQPVITRSNRSTTNEVPKGKKRSKLTLMACYLLFLGSGFSYSFRPPKICMLLR